MNREEILGVVRHALTIMGGYLVSRGVVDEATITVAAGSVTSIIGVVWSIFDKRKA